MEKRDDEILLDFGKIWEIFKKNWLLCVIVVTLCSLIAGLITEFFITETYTAAGKIIVVKQNEGESSANLSYSDVQLSQKLVETYGEIMKSELISDVVTRNLRLDISNSEYNDMLTVGSSGNTEIMEIKVNSDDPRLSADMVNEIIEVFIDKIDNIMNINNVSILNKAKLPTNPSSPSLIRNVAIGFVLGGLISVGLIFLKAMLDTKIKSQEELREIFDYPIIGKIPEFNIGQKGGYTNERQRKRNLSKK